LMGGVRQIYSSSDAAGYAATASQQRMNIYAGMRWTHRSWSVQGQLMQEWVDGRSAPIQPELGMDWNREGPVSVHARVARHYRWPTLNDLHWSPGGNADLQPEYGWSQEVGLGARPARGLTLRVNAWRRHMKDWIMWTLTPGQFFWSAHNVTEVISYGLEARLAYRQPLGAAVFHLESGWDPLRSINQVSIQAPRLEAGQDLLYTPRQQGFLELGCTYQGLTMYYTHRLTGSVRGINEDVAAYDLGWAGIAWSSVWAGSEGRLFLEVANVWDRAYRIVERRPMPGRSFEFGISFNFHKPKP
jgi:vitamin B12 transporter